MNILLWILLSTFIVSLVSFAGVFSLSIKHKLLEKILLFLVALSAGALLGTAFLHLIPESIEKYSYTFLLVLLGFIIFFIIEKFLHWQHCHEDKCSVHTFAYMSLVGGSIHNFLDGLIIAGSFLISVPLGITTTIAIALHEIPQEIGNFGVLVYGGFKKNKALIINFLVTLTKVFGGLVGFLLAEKINLDFIPAIAAGGFIYIAASDLIPELRKDTTKVSILHFLTFIAGLAIMYLVKYLGFS